MSGDLRSMNMDNQATLVEPAKKKQLMTTVYEPTPIEVHLTARDDGEASHARGGHGIFGTPIVSYHDTSIVMVLLSYHNDTSLVYNHCILLSYHNDTSLVSNHCILSYRDTFILCYY